MLGAEGISSPVPNPTPLAGRTGAKVQGAADARLKSMAQEFEATFLSMLLKEMRQTLEPDGGLFPGDTGDVQGGLFDMFLSRHLAASGGVGMAAALERQVRPAAAPKPVTPTHATDHSPPTRGRIA